MCASGKAEEVWKDQAVMSRGQKKEFLIPLKRCAGFSCHLEVKYVSFLHAFHIRTDGLFSAFPMGSPAVPHTHMNDFVCRCLDRKPTMLCSVWLRFKTDNSTEVMQLIKDTPMDPRTKGIMEPFSVPPHLDAATGAL
jgi:hypothetical protein